MPTKKSAIRWYDEIDWSCAPEAAAFTACTEENAALLSAAPIAVAIELVAEDAREAAARKKRVIAPDSSDFELPTDSSDDEAGDLLKQVSMKKLKQTIDATPAGPKRRGENKQKWSRVHEVFTLDPNDNDYCICQLTEGVKRGRVCGGRVKRRHGVKGTSSTSPLWNHVKNFHPLMTKQLKGEDDDVVDGVASKAAPKCPLPDPHFKSSLASSSSSADKPERRSARERMVELRDLLDSGLISEHDFEAKKQAILDSI